MYDSDAKSSEAKSSEGTEGVVDGIDPSVEYKDTSKYESYEKSEGDFVDPATLEQPFAADAALDPAAEVLILDSAASLHIVGLGVVIQLVGS